MKIPLSATISRGHSPWGDLVFAAHDAGLLGIWFDGQKHQPDLSRHHHAVHPIATVAQRQLDAYFAGELAEFDVPLDLSTGTEFQQSVWRALLGVPHGLTISYGALSTRVGKPSAVRAVAGAVGRNPVTVIVPCHRIIGSNGALTGYAGGLHRKVALLELETRKH